MEFWQFLKENYLEIISCILWVCGMFTFSVKTVGVKKTHSLINISFKTNTERFEKVHNRLLEQSKAIEESANRIALEAKELIQTERKKMEEEIIALKASFNAEITLYRECITDIVKNEKSLVTQGVSENIVKRFEENEIKKNTAPIESAEEKIATMEEI